MKPGNKVTERDIVRMHRGEIEDLTELGRVLDAVESEPKLRMLLELLQGPDDKESEEEVPFSLPDLRRTRLYRIKSVEELGAVVAGGSCTTEIEYEVDGTIATFELRLETANGRSRLIADWPRGQKPIGLVLGDFDLTAARIPCRKILPSRQVRPAESPYNGDARKEHSYSAAAKSSEQADGFSDTFFNAAISEDGELWVRGRIPHETRMETLVVEATTDHGEVLTGLVDLEREGAGLFTEMKTAPFWPEGTNIVSLVVRPLDNSDVPRLNSEQVSLLLSEPDRFVAVPITAGENNELNLEFRYSFDKKAAATPDIGWFLRVQEGGAA